MVYSRRAASSPRFQDDQVTAEQLLPLVVIVDDDRFVRRLVGDALGKHYRILEAADAGEGMKIVSSSNPSLLITDAIMPGLSGLDFARLVRADEATCSVPIMLLTGLDAPESEAGLIDDVMSKPFGITEFREAVKRLVKTE